MQGTRSNQLVFCSHANAFDLDLISYLYDGFRLYADALNEAINDGECVTNGTAIIKRIINRGEYK